MRYGSLPANASVFGSKWVFSLKLKSDGTIDRYKAHWLLKVSNMNMALTMRKQLLVLLDQGLFALSAIKKWLIYRWL